MLLTFKEDDVSTNQRVDESKNEENSRSKINALIEQNQFNAFIEQNSILALDLGGGEISPDFRPLHSEGLQNVIFTIKGKTADLHTKYI